MRLIDADELKRRLDNQQLMEHLCKVGKQENSQNLSFALAQLIDIQPTAYDVDKVVEQLEELKSQVPVNRILDDIIKDKPKELGQLIAYGKAIEVTKAGMANES